MEDILTDTGKDLMVGNGKTDIREFLPKEAFITKVEKFDVEEVNSQGNMRVKHRVFVEYLLGNKPFRANLPRKGKQWEGVSL